MTNIGTLGLPRRAQQRPHFARRGGVSRRWHEKIERDSAITPDDYPGDDSAKVQRAFEEGIATARLVLLNRTYEITRPIVIPTIPFDASTRYKLRIHSDGAKLQKVSSDDNRFIVATRNFADSVDEFTQAPYFITGVLTLDGGGIVDDGLVAASGEEVVAARLIIRGCGRFGLRKPGVLSDEITPFSNFGGGFAYPDVLIYENTIGISIEVPDPPCFYADYEIGGGIYDNSDFNIHALQGAGSRWNVETFWFANMAAKATASCFFANCLGADFSGSIFGCQLKPWPGSRFTFSNLTAAADPGAGLLRFNNADPGAATQVYISETDADALGIGPTLDVWDAENLVLAVTQATGNPVRFCSFSVTSMVDNGAWRTLNITPIANLAGAFANGSDVYIAPAGRVAAEFTVGQGDVNLHNVTFQNGDCAIGFEPAETFYKRAMVTGAYFLGGACLRHTTNTADKLIFAAANQFENGAYKFRFEGQLGLIQAHGDWLDEQGKMVWGLQDSASAFAVSTLQFLSTGVDLSSGKVLSIGGVQILDARKLGWGAPTGTKNRTTFVTDGVALPDLAARVGALIDDLIAHGLIGP